MNYFFLDFETRSKADLRKVGADNYARDPSTEVISIAYAIDDGDVRHIQGKKFSNWPTACVYVAHNIEFEQAILCHQYHQAPSEWLDTMALAAAMSLPLSLKELAEFFGYAKGDTRAVKKLSRPRRPSKDNADEFWERDTKPDDYEELDEYNRNDVEVMRLCLKKMSLLTQREKRIWNLTRSMNERGVQVDMPALSIAVPLLASERDVLNAKLSASTGCSPRSPVKLASYFGLPNVKRETVERALSSPRLPPQKRSLLEMRLVLGKSSVGKLEALRQRTSPDGLLRGSLVYGGAQRTGRWSSRGVQLQNLPRGLGILTDDAFEFLKAGQLTGTPKLMPEMIRGFLLGPFIVGDFSQIEARILAWLAGDEKQTQQWANGHDLYRSMAARIYNKPEGEVTLDERYIGKRIILGCGYGMGGKVRDGKPSKFQTTLASEHIHVSPQFAELAVTVYRTVYPSVVQLWYGVERLFRQALCSGGRRTHPRGLAFERATVRGVRYLLVTLPSGRRLYYAQPSCDVLGQLTAFAARRDFGRGPGIVKLYGGKLVENIVQAIARDVMADRMLALDEKKFALVLTVHDEVVSKDDGRMDEFKQTMRQTPKWAQGLPLDVEVFQCLRYRK